MLLVLYKGFLFVICIIYLCEANIIVELQILNYHNQHNKMHNGKFCENFHWAGDHCDPMFTVKASSMNGRLLFYKFVNFHANRKSVGVVLRETFEVYNFYDIIQVEVVVDDHDRYDDHDHIAKFNTYFYSEKQNFRYFNKMHVAPYGMDVSLDASVLVKCIPHYYGKTCSQYCVSERYFSCDPNTGIKICKIDCGYGKCKTINDYWHRDHVICSCFDGWKGPNCKTKIQLTTKIPIPITSKKTTTFSTSTISKTSNFHTSSSTKIIPTQTGKSIHFTTERKSDQTSQHHLVSKSKLLPQQNDERRVLAEKLKQPDKIDNVILKVVKQSIMSNMSSNTKNIQTRTEKSLYFTTKRNSDQTSRHFFVSKSNLLTWQNDERSVLAGKLKQLDKMENGQDVGKHMKSFQIILISSLILSLLVILIIGFKYWKLRYKLKLLNMSLGQRQLPPIRYRIGNKSNNSELYILPESEYDICTSATITEYDDDYLEPKTTEDDIYEKPISK